MNLKPKLKSIVTSTETQVHINSLSSTLTVNKCNKKSHISAEALLMHLCKHVNTELVHSKAALCFPFTENSPAENWKPQPLATDQECEISRGLPSVQPSGSKLLKEGHSGLGALQRQLRRR